jgi:hypothetical protein
VLPLAQELQAIHHWHQQIEHDCIGLMLFRPIQRDSAVVGGDDVKAGVRETFFEESADDRLVLDHEHSIAVCALHALRHFSPRIALGAQMRTQESSIEAMPVKTTVALGYGSTTVELRTVTSSRARPW